MKFRAILGASAFLMAAHLPAAAGFLPPSAWQSTGHASQAVLAIRAAVEEAVDRSRLSDDGLLDEERDALLAFYDARAHATLWIAASGATARADALVAVLRDAASHALPVDAYAFAVDAAGEVGPGSTVAERARAEAMLTSAALIYARHASAGQIDPRTLGRHVDVDPERIEPAAILADLAGAVDVAAVLEGLHPQTDDYRALRAEFLALAGRLGEARPTTVPAGILLKPGMSGARVAALRARLIETGDFAPRGGVDTEEFDEALEAAVRAFQERNGLSSDGVVGPGTLAILNTDVETRMRLIAVNMERRRWLPKSLGARHVFVNQAEFVVRVLDDGETVHQARVVIGKRQHQTPEFSDQIETVVFNPYWNVPASIATNEYLPHLRQNPMALSRMGIEFFDRSSGRSVAIDPRDVDWQSVDTQSFRYGLRQPPMSGNALGQVKFLFPNRHSVYMHDTPSRSLFANATRASSHGCVRVQNPLDLAEVLLTVDGWTRAGIDRAVARGANQHIALKQAVPVHITYWTVWADPAGALHIAQDIYGRDARLADALGFSADALKMAELASN